jgi:hypothetical protein
MKKIIFSTAVVALMFASASCEKEQTCICSGGGISQTYEFTSKKKDAQSTCNELGKTWIQLGATCTLQ